MSLNPEISGFSLAALRSLLGSGDRAALQALRASARDRFDGDAGPILTIVERAVMDGAPFPDLDAETEDHAWAMMLLASHGQTTTPTDSFIRKVTALRIFADAVEKTLPRDVALLLRGLASGRPMLGRRVESDWSYYGWLSREELARLLRALEELSLETPDPGGDGYRSAFLDWLRVIEAAGQDLWLFAI